MGTGGCLSSMTFIEWLRLFRFIFALIVACAIGSSFRNDDDWTAPIHRATGFLMFTAIVTTLYDSYTFLFSVDAKLADCTIGRRYRLLHSIIEGILVIFWWAALGAVATALGGMLSVGDNRSLSRRAAGAYAYDDGYWKPDGVPQTQDNSQKQKPEPTPSPTKNGPVPTQTMTPQMNNNDANEDGIDWEQLKRGKGQIVGGVACSGLVGAISTIIWIMMCRKAIRI